MRGKRGGPGWKRISGAGRAQMLGKIRLREAHFLAVNVFIG